MRIIVFLVSLSLSIMTSMAQTQQGYVKTRGRMVNGKHIKGLPLTGSMVDIKGQNKIVVLNVDGSFSFPTTNRSFFIQSVTKNGYQLVDADAAPRQYSHSSSPIYLVMETPDEHLQDQLTAERKIRRTLQRRLETLENEIEARNISFQEKQQLLERLYRQQEGDEKLIAEMARRYAEMDFDQLDETNRRISDAILNGRLTEADSLLRTKGDIQTRIAEVLHAQVVEAREAAELARRQKTLAESQAGTQARIADVARDCYTRYELCKMTHQMDSAAIYLKLRVELDTTNAIWQRDAAQFLFNFLSDTDRSIEYANRALRLAEEQQVEELQAELHMLLGNIYDSKKEVDKSISHYRNGATIVYRRYGANHPIVAEYLYQSYPHIYFDAVGFLLKQYIYQRTQELAKGLALDSDTVYPEQCISIWKNTLQNPIAGTDSCWILRRLGDAYYYIERDLKTANNYYSRAMIAYEQRDGRPSLEVGRMLYCMGDCNYSLLRQSLRDEDQGSITQWVEGLFARFSFSNFAESAEMLCSVVSPYHSDVRKALESLRNVYEVLRSTPCNADSIYASAHPLLARYQQLQQELGVWEEQPDTASTDEGRLEKALTEVWNESRRRSAWITIWKEVHSNETSIPPTENEIHSGMTQYRLK